MHWSLLFHTEHRGQFIVIAFMASLQTFICLDAYLGGLGISSMGTMLALVFILGLVPYRAMVSYTLHLRATGSMLTVDAESTSARVGRNNI